MIRYFMRSALVTTSLAALAMPATSLAQTRSAIAAATATGQHASMPRQRVALSEGWEFNLVSSYNENGTLPPLEDPKWQAVTVPHTWNRLGYYRSDPETHVNTADSIEKTQGVGWYSIKFDTPDAPADSRVFLEFDAVSRTAEVYVNGKLLGKHRNPFGRFRLDATDLLRSDGPNQLNVKVDNTQPVEGNSTQDVLPMTGDFFVRGGMYRPVSLIVTQPAHFDMLDFGGPGVYAQTTGLTANAAEIGLQARVSNDGESDQSLDVIATLIDNMGNTVGYYRQDVAVPPGETRELDGLMQISSPHPWNGIADPYLYTLHYELRDDGGRLLDVIDQPFGIRQMEIDPERGFILNGKRYQLRGAGLHQDNEQSDWAMSPEEVDESLKIMLDMGANSLRLSHYQHGAPVHDLADRYGIILWDEIGLVTAWTNSNDQTEAPADIVDNARLQLLELIHQNFNHSSVAAWGIANEVDFGPGRPDFLGRPPEVVADPMPLLNNLAALSRELDPNRSVVLANCCEERGMKDVPVVAQAVDAVGANRYFGWYYGKPDELGEHLDDLRRKHPQIPLSVSEYGAGGAPNMHTDNPLGGPVNVSGKTQPEEFMTLFHEENWRQLAPRDYLWGIWLWNAFDFGTTVRAEGDAQDINTKGLVTYDRKIRKDAYYFYQTNWSDEPTVHVQGRRYVDRAYPITDVRVNSNAPATTLIVNGSELGTKRDCDQNVCVWPDVSLTEGDNNIVARGFFADGPMEDAIIWKLGEAQSDAFRIDSGTVLAAGADVQFGSDNFFMGGAAKFG